MSEQRIVSIDITYLVEQALRPAARPDSDEDDSGEE